MTSTRTAVRRVEVTTPTGRRFVRASTLFAAQCVYAEHDGYRLREVWGFALPDGFHYLSDTPGDPR